MDEMTQQNAVLVEETTGAIQSAASQVADLRSAASFFRTDRPVGAAARDDVTDDPEAGRAAA